MIFSAEYNHQFIVYVVFVVVVDVLIMALIPFHGTLSRTAPLQR